MITRFLLGFAAVTIAVAWYLAGAPCSSPITWRVGELDARFGLSKEELLSVMERAEAVWESASGKDLFRYEEDGSMPINFVYDERQRTAQENAQRRETIEEGTETADELRRKYESASSRYESAKKDFLKL